MNPRASLPRSVRLKPASFACMKCASKSRSITTTPAHRSSNSNLPNAIPPRSYSALRSRRLITLSGPDSAHFLQGVITNDIASKRTTAFYSAFLNATGRVLNDVFIYPLPAQTAPSLLSSAGGKFGFVDGHTWAIEVDANEADRLFKHIKRYKLRAKFDLNVADAGIWSLWKEEPWKAHSMLPQSSDMTLSFGENGVVCADTRAPGMGYRVLLPVGAKPQLEADESPETVYKVRRYLKGVPEGQDEILRDSALPAESNLDFMGGVHFNKGCYVGQELTIRTRHTGVVRKRILPVMLYGMDEPEPSEMEWKGEGDAELVPKENSISRVGKKGRSAGKFLNGVGNLGLGLCRLEIMTDLVVQGEGGGYKQGDEFMVDFGGDDEKHSLKIKAFVPSWHLTK